MTTAKHYFHSMLLLCAGIFSAQIAIGQTAWVSDEFEVMLRTGPSTNNAIQLMVGSGTRLEVLETDAEAGYSRVTTTGGTEGWVLTRYLMGEPAAREQLQQLTAELTDATTQGSTLGSQLNALKAEYETASRQIDTLQGDKAALQSELDEIKKTASDVLSIDSQNKNLRQQLTDAEIHVSILEQENENLGSRRNVNWFITGALVLFGGVLVGLILPRLKFQKRSRYDRF